MTNEEYDDEPDVPAAWRWHEAEASEDRQRFGDLDSTYQAYRAEPALHEVWRSHGGGWCRAAWGRDDLVWVSLGHKTREDAIASWDGDGDIELELDNETDRERRILDDHAAMAYEAHLGMPSAKHHEPVSAFHGESEPMSVVGLAQNLSVLLVNFAIYVDGDFEEMSDHRGIVSVIERLSEIDMFDATLDELKAALETFNATGAEIEREASTATLFSAMAKAVSMVYLNTAIAAVKPIAVRISRAQKSELGAE